MFNAVALGLNDQDRNWQCSQVLLEFDVLIHCEEYIEPSCSERKELTVLYACPSTTRHR